MATLEESLLEIPPLEPEEIETIETVEAEDYLYNEEHDSGEGKRFPCMSPLIELDFSMGPEAKRRRQVGSKILTPFPQISSAQDTIDTSTVTKVQKKNYARKAKLGKRRTQVGLDNIVTFILSNFEV